MTKVIAQNKSDLISELKKYKNKEKEAFYPKFFKTGKGEYGEKDIFLGVSVPNSRKVAIKFQNINLNEIKKLIHNEIHEVRLCALLILTEKYEKEKQKQNIQNQKKIFEFYLENLKGVNNWDLVDTSSYKIIGEYLKEKSTKEREILYKFAKSNDLWKKRIAIISTFAFIKNNDFEDTIKISEILLNDKHDLIHKAVGWMLREMGKKDIKSLEIFLEKHARKMPRTALRYSIEKFEEKKRKYYLNM